MNDDNTTTIELVVPEGATVKVTVDGNPYPLEDTATKEGYKLEWPGDGYRTVLEGSGDISMLDYWNENYFAQYNAFNSQLEAENERDYRAVAARVLQCIEKENEKRGWVCDWTDNIQIKHRLYCWCHDIAVISVTSTTHQQSLPPEFYFTSEVYDILKAKFTDDELITFVCKRHPYK